ncbi:ribonuclease HI family protein [Patescibacteria group bacterium]|jgi:ribonuclease HI|nr:ribonuclease HI family protein [Patescibacteria group bacterium]
MSASLGSLRIRTDGGSRGNPGPSGIGVVIEDATTGKVLEEHSRYLGMTTNNQAEYQAVILGLKRCIELGAKRVEVCADSELLVKQAKGEYRVKNPELQKRFRELQECIASFEKVVFTHVYREANTAADALANEAMDAGTAGSMKRVF